MRSWKNPLLSVLIGLYAGTATFVEAPAEAKEIDTNSAYFANVPAWLTRYKAERVTDKVQRYLEWDVRKVRVTWHTDAASFEKLHGFGDTVLAFARKQDNSVHIGPRVTEQNFETVYGHELVHIILFQKFKDAIPRWLEEGLANYVSSVTASKRERVDYKWLATQPPRDVTQLTHPFVGFGESSRNSVSATQPRYHYTASTALIELIASRCDLRDILQLAVGKKLENYLSTYCRITDINSEFLNFVKKKSQKN